MQPEGADVSEKREAVWQGRLAAGLDARAQKLNDSLPVDGRLVTEELALSRAYATTLAAAVKYQKCAVI